MKALGHSRLHSVAALGFKGLASCHHCSSSFSTTNGSSSTLLVQLRDLYCSVFDTISNMRSGVLLLLLAAFFAYVQAQNALVALSEHMPKCSVRCSGPNPLLTFKLTIYTVGLYS